MKTPRNISFTNSKKVLVLIIVLAGIGAFLYFENNFITITVIWWIAGIMMSSRG